MRLLNYQLIQFHRRVHTTKIVFISEREEGEEEREEEREGRKADKGPQKTEQEEKNGRGRNSCSRFRGQVVSGLPQGVVDI